MASIPDSPALWELAYMDGSSIYVKVKQPTTIDLTFGPFLFLTFKHLCAYQNTQGPLELLGSLDTPIQAQEVSLPWVLDNVFRPDDSDCMVINDMLIPLTPTGAVAADASINEEAGEKNLTPWSSMFKTCGPEFMRIHTAGMVQEIVTPGQET